MDFRSAWIAVIGHEPNCTLPVATRNRPSEIPIITVLGSSCAPCRRPVYVDIVRSMYPAERGRCGGDGRNQRYSLRGMTDRNGAEGPQTAHKIRFVTATSLFDGHDASINIMRRILQSQGAEVIHLGHNRSVDEVVTAAITEDVQGVAVSAYQGGHMEFYRYIRDLLRERDAGHIRIWGGGGTILPSEGDELPDTA